MISKENQDLPFKKQRRIKQLLPNVSEDVCDLIEKLISVDPNERPDPFQALQHVSFFKICQAEKIYQEKHHVVPFPIFYKIKFKQIEKSKLPIIFSKKIQKKHKKGN
jgi:serine/threonine protein kinase